jgi:hypothetical protein
VAGILFGGWLADGQSSRSFRDDFFPVEFTFLLVSFQLLDFPVFLGQSTCHLQKQSSIESNALRGSPSGARVKQLEMMFALETSPPEILRHKKVDNFVGSVDLSEAFPTSYAAVAPVLERGLRFR